MDKVRCEMCQTCEDFVRRHFGDDAIATIREGHVFVVAPKKEGKGNDIRGYIQADRVAPQEIRMTAARLVSQEDEGDGKRDDLTFRVVAVETLRVMH
jgi:hypothetical protein